MTRSIKQQLEYRSGLKLQLKINDNRSTMLSVKWDPDCTKVSLHQMFLQAPKNIMDALACYLQRKNTPMPHRIKSFIDENLKKLDYSHLIDKSKLHTVGETYDLQKIFDDINKQYFKVLVIENHG